MNFTSVHLACHEFRIIAHLFVWFVMNFASAHLFVWSVVCRVSIRLVCHELRIYSPGLPSAVHPFVWFVMSFASSRICSFGLS